MSYPVEKADALSPSTPTGSNPEKSAQYQVTKAEIPSQPLQEPVRQKWYQWFAPTDTPEERRLIIKLDVLIMLFVFLAYWAKVLDQSATSAAYVSGMKEDLHLFGNELNYLNTTYMVGFITLQIPLTILVSYLPEDAWILRQFSRC
ncbi:hypothetical protein NQ176_g1357 [Zarea fungicola]|uniref:Uncharacterized protein n=1 Tax=Zarea fungicola TaxID=93591 RepID=A0ACC1NT26_9HYPO|nr:hypothetical protein NQ176_g1357 [Lecanicillium fungicola]